MEPTEKKKETKQDRFKRIAEKRTKRILNEIRILGNCSNRSGYEYSEEDIQKIFNAIEEKVKVTKARFTSDKKPEFKL